MDLVNESDDDADICENLAAEESEEGAIAALSAQDTNATAMESGYAIAENPRMTETTRSAARYLSSD